MPQLPDPARLTRLCTLSQSSLDTKVRVAGRFLGYEPQTGYVLLHDPSLCSGPRPTTENALVVDISDCLDSSGWLQEPGTPLIVLGWIEQNNLEHNDVPSLSTKNQDDFISRKVVPHKSFILRALIVRPVSDLDLTLWNVVIDERELEIGSAVGT